MKNRRLIVDRPPLESKDIQAGMNFSQLMMSYQVMSKPFYKTKWFFGTAGMASIGLLVGGTIVFNQEETSDSALSQNPALTESIPQPDLIVPEENKILALDIPAQAEERKETYMVRETKQNKDGKNTTQVNESAENSAETSGNAVEDEVAVGTSDENPIQNAGFDPMDLTPRIAGKLNGEITRDELFDNKGLTTNSDVSIIHFELHLIDGLGGKVFEEESNQLNQQMKTAIGRVERGETIYFENIRGKTSDGHVVRLNPLRYVLLN